jgi:putative glutamine amidotransferase
MATRQRKHIKVGIWENAPFLSSIAKGIDSLNSFLSLKEYDLDYSLIRLNTSDSKAIDILFLDGGEDVNPSLYGEENLYSNFSEKRDKAEFDLLARYECSRISGVCRGLQLLNVWYGGTLFQDINHYLRVNHTGSHEVEVLDSSLRKHWNTRRTYEEEYSESRKTFLEKFISKTPFLVSSLHHQAINRLSNTFIKTLQCRIVEKSKTTTIIEGIESLNGYIRAVQSHPEFTYFPQTDGLLFSYLMHVDHYISANEIAQQRHNTVKPKATLDYSSPIYGEGTSTVSSTFYPLNDTSTWTVPR